MTDYTVTDGQFYKVLDKDTGAVMQWVSYLTQIHFRQFTTSSSFQKRARSWRPKPEALSETKMI